jgi:nucleoid-associated protein YgaU
MYAVAASRPRCLVVATGLTAALWGAAAVGIRSLVDPAGARTLDPAGALERCCIAALVLVAVWAWLQGLAGVTDAWRGMPTADRSGVRGLALAACGVALATALAPAAVAAEGSAGDGPPADPLSGLPLPDRAEGRAAPRAAPVVVRTGDTLWALAQRRLPHSATDRQVTEGWHSIYRRNRGVIGPDPDLIRPGQVLKLTKEKQP